MKRLLFLAALLLMMTLSFAATNDSFKTTASATNTSITIDSQHTDFGDWVRVCSTQVVAPVNDSGYVIITVTGTVTLPRGGALYVGLDSATGATDTLYGFTKVEVPYSSNTAYVETPFAYSFSLDVDSADNATAHPYDSLPSFVVTMATRSSGQALAVKHVVAAVQLSYVGK